MRSRREILISELNSHIGPAMGARADKPSMCQDSPFKRYAPTGWLLRKRNIRANENYLTHFLAAAIATSYPFARRSFFSSAFLATESLRARPM